jgi:hypothetical protein
MKVNYLKNVLFCGTMFLTLLGSTQMMNASLPENLTLMQQERKISGTVTDAILLFK